MNKEDMVAYQARWQAVTEVERQELLRMSTQEKWKKFTSIYNLAFGLGLLKADPTEGEIYKKWAKLKEKVENPGR